MTGKYVIQHVGYPIVGRLIRADEWHNLSTHVSLWEAMRAIKHNRSHLDYGQWDDHYRIITGKGFLVNELHLTEEWNKHNVK